MVFNGHPQELDEKGCKADGIDRMGPGIFTRGILVDMPLLKGVEYLGAWYADLSRGSGGLGKVRARQDRQRRRAAGSHRPLGAAREAGAMERRS